MDNTKQFTTLEWCAGYGGIQLGLKRAIPNLRTIAYSEIEAFACANLVAKMEAGYLDAAPIWPDLKTFPCSEFHRKVDCLIAGYPCQPFSAAGKRQGADDPRHLWPFIRKAIRIIQPRYCFFENVEGHISLGLSTVISDLEEDGYRTTWGIFSAEEVGAPHRRKRVFILANRIGSGMCGGWGGEEHNYEQKRILCTEGERHEIRGEVTRLSAVCRKEELANKSGERLEGSIRPSVPRRRERPTVRSCQELANRHGTGLEGLWECSATQGREKPDGQFGSRCQVWPARPGQPQYEWEPPRTVVGNTKHDGYATAENRGSSSSEQEKGGVQELTGGCEQTANECEIESPLDRNFNECANRLGDAKLYESCDNRTDELRLLGNGVVPATVSLAWKTLYGRFLSDWGSDGRAT